MNPLSEVTNREHPEAPPANDTPQPGDLILVECSQWYALQDGELLRICEPAGWITSGREIYVAPRRQVRTFWGPDHGSPDGIQPLRMSTSGGPFKSITLDLIAPLERVERRLDQFWHWVDWPRAGGGWEYQREITLWKLALLPASGTYRPVEEQQR